MAEEVVAVVPAVVVDENPTDEKDAIRIILRKALEVNGVIRGLSEVARSLDRRVAHLCILADDCDVPDYAKLIKALCQQNNIDLIEVPKESLAAWAGLQKFDAAGNVKKSFKCSSVAIRDFGERTKALDMILAALK